MAASSHIEDLSLVELLDRVLNQGVVIMGDLTISVADVDLIHLKLNLLLASVAKLTEVAKGVTDGAKGATEILGAPAQELGGQT